MVGNTHAQISPIGRTRRAVPRSAGLLSAVLNAEIFSKTIRIVIIYGSALGNYCLPPRPPAMPG
ncbi:MAG: hypothetical protein ABIN18_21630, partial [Pseudomonadota bacterium]